MKEVDVEVVGVEVEELAKVEDMTEVEGVRVEEVTGVEVSMDAGVVDSVEALRLVGIDEDEVATKEVDAL